MSEHHNQHDTKQPHRSDWYTTTVDEAFNHFQSNADGLTSSSAKKRLAIYGPNTLRDGDKFSPIKLFLSQFMNLMMLLIGVAGLLSLLFGHPVDAVIIFSIMVINAIMGFVQEYRAERSIQALKSILVTKVTVKRDGGVRQIATSELVPGDVVILEPGVKIPADGRLIHEEDLEVSEAALTGESLPVKKITDVLDEKQSAIADQLNMAWMGTIVEKGTGEMIVVATGESTQFGQIAKHLKEIKSEPEHFYKRLSTLSKQMGGIAISSAIITFIIGFWFRGFSIIEITLYTIATLVSALPEGLPIILVIVLATGAQRMAKKRAIVRKLSATETLGVVSVILTDKTGTLTQNVMSVQSVVLPKIDPYMTATNATHDSVEFRQGEQSVTLSKTPLLKHLLTILGSCNSTKISAKQDVRYQTLIGDPTERALFLLSYQSGQYAKNATVLADLPFQQEIRMRASIVRHHDQTNLYAIGAPEHILQRSSLFAVEKNGEIDHKRISPEDREAFSKILHDLSGRGLRIIGVVEFPQEVSKKDEQTLHIEDLDRKDGVFLGYVAIYDPPRAEVKSAIEDARAAGIRVIMATGDHPETALAIGKEIGLVEKSAAAKDVLLSIHDLDKLSDPELKKRLRTVSILARLSPEAKLRVATLLKKDKQIVAMTGDGVNDAPALKKADVGISMGISGTDVAREASKIVLADDNFASIVSAIREGRTQFSNLRRTSFFLIVTNISESFALLVALFIGMPLPLLPVQILWLNVITGGLTDVALALEPPHEDTMKHPPRNPNENILTLKILPMLLIITGVIAFIGLVAFYLLGEESLNKGRTAIFTILACSQVLLMYSFRSLRKSIFQLSVVENKAVFVVTILAGLLLAIAIYVEPVRRVFQFEMLSLQELSYLGLASFAILLVAELSKKAFPLAR